MTTFEVQLIKRYAEKHKTTWDAMVKSYCENVLIDAINDARAEITKDLTTEQIAQTLINNQG